jgi:AcrR family transcriptional regulator
MARPKSEDKRRAILAAATQVIAESGLGAATARIAKVAGVAEGTVFTYFASKDALLNALYLDLKDEMREAMMSRYPSKGSVKKRVRHIWEQYVTWGAAHPQARQAMAQLSVSDRLTAKTKAAGAAPFAAFDAMMREAIADGTLRGHSAAFVNAIINSIGETTMEFMTRRRRLGSWPPGSTRCGGRSPRNRSDRCLVE